MSQPRSLDLSFPDISNEDRIVKTFAGASSRPGYVEFILETAPGITWWKGLELHSGSGRVVRAETQDARRGPVTVGMLASELVGGKLVILKAKLFGIHTGMYHIENLSGLGGRSFHLGWERDEHVNGPVAGFFQDVGRGVVAAADWLGNGLSMAFTYIGGLLGTVIEALGTVAALFVDALGRAFGLIPGIGPALQAPFRLAARTIASAFDLAATVVRGAFDIAGGLVGGAIRLLGGLLGGLMAWDAKLLLPGLADIGAAVGGAVIAFLARVLDVAQTVLPGLQMGERSLNGREVEMLQRVFRKSVNLYNVRVVEGFAGAFSAANNRPFAVGNRIYMKRVDSAVSPHILVHEVVHVWQFQRLGTRYVMDALWAQQIHGGGAYAWRDEFARGNFRWRDFNKEAQGALIEEVFAQGTRFVYGSGSVPTPGPFFDDDPVGTDVSFMRDGVDYTPFARESVLYMRTH